MIFLFPIKCSPKCYPDITHVAPSSAWRGVEPFSNPELAPLAPQRRECPHPVAGLCQHDSAAIPKKQK